MPNAVFVGDVVANVSVNDVFLLGPATSGTLVGFATAALGGFSTLAEATGATWTLLQTYALGVSQALNIAGVTTIIGTLTDAGAVTNTGTIVADDGILRMLGIVDNSGKLFASADGTLDLSAARLTGLAGGTLTLGTLRANAGSTIDLPDNTIISSDGANLTLFGAGATIQSLDTANHTDIALDTTLDSITTSGTFSLVDGSNFTATANQGNFTDYGLLVLQRTTFAATTLTIAANGVLEGYATVRGEVVNEGTITASKGAMTFVGNVINNGAIYASASSVAIAGSLTGSGTITLGAGSKLSFLGSAASSDTLDFQAESSVIDLSHPSVFAAALVGFGMGDVIDLLKTTATGLTYSSGILDIMDGAKTVAALHFSGAYTTSDFSVTADAHGGTDIGFR
jgi:hypothetical protein